jgi:betaine lipid synthase
MSRHLPVTEFFSSIYLVDLSPSLCKVARRRFARLGWTNVKVVCQDARSFRLEDHETNKGESEVIRTSKSMNFSGNGGVPTRKADLLTLSYSLSMIPNYYSVIDAMSSLLSPSGVLGVIDFYVQSKVDLAGRNYTGGVFNRHVNWFGRVFWRAWFEVDRVGLEPGRRDYLEYRFGTILSIDDRNYVMGGIPYYIWIGCQRQPVSPLAGSPDYPHEIIERLDAAVTESPYISPVSHTDAPSRLSNSSAPPDIRSKVFNAAILNLTADLPLPSFFYQNHYWRIHYDEQLKKHTQFKNEFIYAFTWEDPRVDQRILEIGSEDVVLAVTSAGDNILAYALNGPKRIHSVDLNPTQNHLLELKVAAFTALGYTDVWKLFGEGKHVGFRDLLVSKLSPHMSSRAFQYWLDNTGVFASQTGGGLYESGCSRHAIKLVKWLFRTTGLHSEVQKLCSAKNLNEQREIWYGRIRKILLSRVLVKLVAGNPNFLWRALGVPKEQREMIQKDYSEQDALAGTGGPVKTDITGNAIWEYLVNTLDPVVENTLLSEDNYFYMLCLQGKYSRR